jgi:hypothetical protein
MVSGKYFNKGVKALDSPHVGYVVRETSEKIVVFGEGDDRYDVPTSVIRFAAANVLVDLPFYEIVRKYKVDRKDPLPAESAPFVDLPEPVDLAPTKASTQNRSLTRVSGRRTRSTSAT